MVVLGLLKAGYTIRIRQHRKGKCASPTPSRNRKVFAPIKLQAIAVLQQQVLADATWALQQQPITVTAQSSPRELTTMSRPPAKTGPYQLIGPFFFSSLS